ncbi:pilus assembly protein PilB [Calothrix sp. UHCC 0171]|uniref:GspE/PulE/PilB domain-containing protein n=1 Tax=Calothrix sp. UHCC 0171 TaxID=3110245 RepID=UPI002B1FD139|nr:pilus assembly protein PilB [Calothrix sp. UHCC 0171]MEA5569646.1 pilus assembly protein PilB [Calothrix sp. UHCC 0171]
MLSSEGKPIDTEVLGEKVSPDTELQWNHEPEREQIIQLIENFLSFEVCLYHQILPLRLEDKSLILGMVNPEDEAALDYVNRILIYVNYTMTIQAMSAENHRSILSAYLNYKNTSQPLPQQVAENEAYSPESSPQAASTEASSDPQVEAEAESEEINSHQIQPEDNTENTPAIEIPHLLVPEPNEFTPVELLSTLPPKKFLEELLGRVITGGIGRLYFERLPYEGKILWSENGVLQSVLEKLPLSVFQGALNELKKFAGLRFNTLSEAKQVEKEYLYQQQRLLLRLRVMPGMYGDEATLQVLRGAALKFYQQQQFSRISRDAIGISQQLSYKLHELQQRMLSNRNISNESLETLKVLNRLLNNLDNQIKELTESEESKK